MYDQKLLRTILDRFGGAHDKRYNLLWFPLFVDENGPHSLAVRECDLNTDEGLDTLVKELERYFGRSA